MTETYRHTPDMGEISGFGVDGGQGAKYEACCQDMLNAGVVWAIANPKAEPLIETLENVTGLVFFNNAEAKQLEKALLDASKGQATGAMMQAVTERIAYIHHHGWDTYCAEMRRLRQTDKA